MVVVARGMPRPWGLAFLPDGSMLVTERAGRGCAWCATAPGSVARRRRPGSTRGRLGGLMEWRRIRGLPRTSWSTSPTPSRCKGSTALVRGRWDGTALTDVKDIFVAEAWCDGGAAASRLAFGPDGMLYMTTGASVANMKDAQDPGHHKGKVLRLSDDGTVPATIRSWDARPQAGNLFARPPQPARARDPPGDRRRVVERERAEWRRRDQHRPPRAQLRLARRQPRPDYAGPWQGKFARTASSRRSCIGCRRFAIRDGVLHRRSLPGVERQRLRRRDGDGSNQGRGTSSGSSSTTGEELRREMLLGELRQRIRDVRQGPDGFLYVLTEEEDGAVLRLEPAN